MLEESPRSSAVSFLTSVAPMQVASRWHRAFRVVRRTYGRDTLACLTEAQVTVVIKTGDDLLRDDATEFLDCKVGE